MEVWKPIENLDGYDVSDLGRIRSHKRTPTIILKQKLKTARRKVHGQYNAAYAFFPVRVNGIKKEIRVHILVAKAFVENPHPDQYDCVNHLDGKKLNNIASNLEWTTQAGNKKHAYNNGLVPRGEGNGKARLKERDIRTIRAMIKDGIEQKAIACVYGVNDSVISNIKLGVTWNHVPKTPLTVP